jgi:hypothetical protein
MKTIGIYPAQFQPPHQGHFAAYKKLQKVAGPDTFVVTTDYDPTLEAALHFGDKEQVLTRHGVDASHIRKVRDLNNPVEVLENFDPETTVVIYALNPREAQRRLSGSDYYKPLGSSGGKNLPFKSAAYILSVNDDLIYKNKVYTSKNIREALGSHRFSTKNKQEWFKHFFGWFDLGLFELLKNKYESAHSAADGVENPVNMKEELAKEICNILNELMGGPPSIANQDSMGTDAMGQEMDTTDITKSKAEQEKEKADNLKTLQQQKTDLERKNKLDQSQLSRDKNSVDNLRKTTIPGNRDALDQVNKQISTGGV